MESASRSTKLSDIVAKEIRVLLLRRDMKQSELAAKMGVSEMWLSRRLRGAQSIDLNDLALIADALEVEVTYFLPRNDEGRLVATGGSTEGRRSQASLTFPQLAKWTRPNGHPKRTGPDRASRRPARISLATAHS